ncbi:MAG TPA: glycosyltransferase family 87 protein [Acidobacteriaceae bacterium]|nr:glycosyltransferase family 87 protein [Acidobacteriaceae bacterium]
MKKTLSILAATLIALAGVLVLTLIHHPGRMDYIEYWSSGRLITQHVNPYSTERIFALEKSAGATFTRALIMPNPPWMLFLVAPLGFVGKYTGLFLWQVVSIGCVLASILLLNKQAKNGPLALIFAPVFASLLSGQSSPLLLLGFSLFLHFYGTRPFLAGASLLLMAFKPHLFLVFWAVLLVDCLYRRKFRILAGGVTALCCATAISLCFDLHVWQHYLAIIFGYHYSQDFLPTPSELFRVLIDANAFWLLFVPSVVGVFWGLWYYSRRKQIWDWRSHGMLLMLVTIFVSPYSFFTDEVVLLPSIFFVMALSNRRKYSGWILLAINTAALSVVAFIGNLISPWYIWTSAAWLLWFLYATNGFRRFGEQEVPASDTVQIARLEGA